MRFKMILALAAMAFIGCWTVMAEGEAGDLITLENQYIKIFINSGTEETGRFAVDVAAGDPSRADDDGKPLIYGRPKPWTSYTTIRINGRDYVFGRATTQRAGAGLPGGEIVFGPILSDNR